MDIAGPMFKIVLGALFATVIVLPVSHATVVQQPAVTKFKHAVVRTHDSAKITLPVVPSPC